MKKISSIFTAFFIISIFLPKQIQAQGEFLIDTEVEYLLDTSGIVHVKNKISLENVQPTIYAKSYTLNMENIEPLNTKVYENSKELEAMVSKTENIRIIKVNFPDSLVGKGAKREFIINFDVDDFAERTGEVWELSIPKLTKPESFRNYTATLVIPKSFGQKAYLSPESISTKLNDVNYEYIFNKEQLSYSGITAGFGNFQVFSFTLKYHLENPLNQLGETQIPIPPDSSFQKTYYDVMSPKPDSVEVDSDGNWLASYILKPRERIDVEVQGLVQIFAREIESEKPSRETLQNNLKPTEYWQSGDPQIKDLAIEYNTPEKIYNYVTKTLTYDYERVKPNVQRRGALGALKQPNSAICMEFTDLFIAIARAAGIPAREVNGYAYTENPEIQPLSLVSDVLHAWPEYWDYERSAWIPIDPTWGKTSGADYFNKLDLRHFAFVFHGNDSSKPYAPGSYKLGPNPQKDVFVNFAKFVDKSSKPVQIEAKYENNLNPFKKNLKIEIYNPGPEALYEKTVEILFDNNIHKNFDLGVMPPYSFKNISLPLTFSFLGLKNPNNITIIASQNTVNIAGDKIATIIQSLFLLFIPIIAVILFILYKPNKLKLFLLKFKKNNEYKKDSQE